MSVTKAYNLSQPQPLYQPLLEECGEESSPLDSKIETMMHRVILKKEERVAKALESTWERYNPVFIAGDLFTMGYTAFNGVQAICPSLAAISAISMATLVCGEIGGVINIGVAYSSGKEAIQAFKNGDTKLGARLLADCILLVGVGLVMILAALSAKVVGLATIGAFFAANPWFLALLFFVISLPLLVEVCSRVIDIMACKDLASKLRVDVIERHLRSPQVNWEALFTQLNDQNDPEPFNGSETEMQIGERLSARMEKFQANMGVSLAIEAFKLQLMLMKKERRKALAQLERVRKEIADWNRAQYVRFIQQILYMFAFIVSMAALCPKVNGNSLNGGQNIAMAAANGIPLYMDTFWPFKRNTPMVVPT